MNTTTKLYCTEVRIWCHKGAQDFSCTYSKSERRRVTHVVWHWVRVTIWVRVTSPKSAWHHTDHWACVSSNAHNFKLSAHDSAELSRQDKIQLLSEWPVSRAICRRNSGLELHSGNYPIETWNLDKSSETSVKFHQNAHNFYSYKYNNLENRWTHTRTRTHAHTYTLTQISIHSASSDTPTFPVAIS